jgi:hypothetical protein
MLSRITARVTIQSFAPYCQSRPHGEPELEGEGKDDYDARTWRSKMHVINGTVHIPAKGMHDALTEAAKYSKRQIPGQGKATWTQKFASGISLLEDIDLKIDPQNVDFVKPFVNADGKRGGGTRVHRRFPIIPYWKAEFEATILDPIITQEIFTEMLEQAGMFIGIGQNRPQNRGTHGRFKVLSVEFIGEPEIDPRRLRAA